MPPGVDWFTRFLKKNSRIGVSISDIPASHICSRLRVFVSFAQLSQTSRFVSSFQLFMPPLSLGTFSGLRVNRPVLSWGPTRAHKSDNATCVGFCNAAKLRHVGRTPTRQACRPRHRSVTFSAHTASPPPPKQTPVGSRASSRHASIARRTTSAHGPLAWGAPRTRTHRSILTPPASAGA